MSKLTSESDWTARMMKEIVAAGGLVMPIVAHRRGEPGWPDRLVIHTRWTGFVESKVDGRQLTTLQRVRIREIRRRLPNGAVVARRCGDGYCQLEDETGERLALFNGTGLGLLLAMERLSQGEHVCS